MRQFNATPEKSAVLPNFRIRFLMNVRIFRFLASGGSAAAIEYVSFLALQLTLGTSRLQVSQSLSFICGFLLSFSLNRLWVFRSKSPWATELIKYGLLACTNLILGNLVIAVLVTASHLPPLAAKLLVMAMIALWNYIIFSHLIFRESPKH